MNTVKRAEALANVGKISAMAGGRQALRFAINAVSGFVPGFGGAIAGAGASWGEREQGARNNQLFELASLADAELTLLSETLDMLLAGPTTAAMAILLGEVLGDEVANALASGSRQSVPVVLNSATVSELERFISEGWVFLTSTGCVSLMGSGNRVGDHVEELKRPYGMGNGFLLSVEQGQ